MATRKPLVLVDGKVTQLPAGDEIEMVTPIGQGVFLGGSQVPIKTIGDKVYLKSGEVMYAPDNPISASIIYSREAPTASAGARVLAWTPNASVSVLYAVLKGTGIDLYKAGQFVVTIPFPDTWELSLLDPHSVTVFVSTGWLSVLGTFIQYQETPPHVYKHSWIDIDFVSYLGGVANLSVFDFIGTHPVLNTGTYDTIRESVSWYWLGVQAGASMKVFDGDGNCVSIAARPAGHTQPQLCGLDENANMYWVTASLAAGTNYGQLHVLYLEEQWSVPDPGASYLQQLVINTGILYLPSINPARPIGAGVYETYSCAVDNFKQLAVMRIASSNQASSFKLLWLDGTTYIPQVLDVPVISGNPTVWTVVAYVVNLGCSDLEFGVLLESNVNDVFHWHYRDFSVEGSTWTYINPLLPSGLVPYGTLLPSSRHVYFAYQTLATGKVTIRFDTVTRLCEALYETPDPYQQEITLAAETPSSLELHGSEPGISEEFPAEFILAPDSVGTPEALPNLYIRIE